ncbi:MAG TPA: hypothetical protein PLO51_01660 [Candidatus Micrarchaeota archaeon]|nr:hypothetical protein [Candidatus Micrarchaeota archaeon]
MQWKNLVYAILVFLSVFHGLAFAQNTAQPYGGMMGNGMMGGYNPIAQSSVGNTSAEEAEGRAVLEKLQANQTTCANLSDDDFEVLGEYFMGQMAGSQHAAMNSMMVRMMGAEGERQMHITMGGRMSGCQPNASIPQNITNGGMMPIMMQMMMGGYYGSGAAGGYGMMGGWGGSPVFLALLIVALIVLAYWLSRSLRRGTPAPSATEILKQRYAKGEITKKRFDEMKREMEE